MGKEAEKQFHICLYIGSLQRGGAERVMTNLAEYLYGEGWKVTFVTTYFRPPEYVLPHGLWDAETGTPYAGDIAEKNDTQAGYNSPDKSANWAENQDPQAGYALNRTEDKDHLRAEQVSGEVCVHWGADKTVYAEPAGIRRIYSDPPQEELSRGRIHGFAARYRRLREIWKAEKPDVILSFIGYNNSFAILTSRGLHIPAAVSVRSNPAYEYNTAKLRIPAFLLFRQADGVVLQTHEAAEFFPKAIRRKSVILPNAIPADFIRPRYEGERQKRVVCVGRLDDNKNQGFLIEQFAIAHKEHPEYSLHLYGDGPSRKKFETSAQKLGIADAVVFEGVVSGIRDKIEKSMIFVLPSKTEGMPNALLEAMGAGLACISTDCPCGGPRDLIRDGVNGFLVPLPGIHDSGSATMAGRLIQLMDDPELCQRLGRAAAKVQEIYSPEVINGKWKTYLESLIRG